MRPSASWRSSTGYATSTRTNVVKIALRRTTAGDRCTRRAVNSLMTGVLASAFSGRLAKQAARLEDEDQNQHPEHHGLSPAGVEQEVGSRGKHADDHAPGQCARHVADA